MYIGIPKETMDHCSIDIYFLTIGKLTYDLHIMVCSWWHVETFPNYAETNFHCNHFLLPIY